MSKLITSPNNDAIKALARLSDSARARRKADLMVLEGIHLIAAACDAGVLPHTLYVNEDAHAHPEVTALLASRAGRCEVLVLARGVLGRFSALASAPELIALAARPKPQAAAAGASCVLLEDVQDPGNVGTILRSAAASGVRDVYLSQGCVDVYSPKVLRAGMGAHFALALHEGADLAALLDAFPGRRLVTHLAGAHSLYEEDLSGQVALVFGNEGAGVSDALVARADARILIPMPGHAESLNVAMAATVCLFERVRQRLALQNG